MGLCRVVFLNLPGGGGWWGGRARKFWGAIFWVGGKRWSSSGIGDHRVSWVGTYWPTDRWLVGSVRWMRKKNELCVRRKSEGLGRPSGFAGLPQNRPGLGGGGGGGAGYIVVPGVWWKQETAQPWKSFTVLVLGWQWLHTVRRGLLFPGTRRMYITTLP